MNEQDETNLRASELAEEDTESFETAVLDDPIDTTPLSTPLSRAERKAKKKQDKLERSEKKKGLSGTRLVAVIAGVSVLSLAAGIVLMKFIVSPSEIAARTEAPEPGPVTSLVEKKLIENSVTIRGEVTYADSVSVTLDTASAEGRPIVTGQVPEVGAILDAGNVAMEVTGRPVIVLPGELPSYRNLSIGMSGPDVLQLKEALSAMGYYPGDTSSNVFQWETSEAVGALYQNIGYSPATGGSETREMLRSAEAAYRTAETSVTKAETSWNEANNAGEDTSVAWAEVQEARQGRSDAWDQLQEAQVAVQPTLPAGEVLFLPSLPRRVDEVFVKRGAEVNGPVMTVSGADLTILGTVNSDQAALLTAGMEAVYASPDGEELTATVSTIEAPSGAPSSDSDKDTTNSDSSSSAGRYTVSLNPGELTEEQISSLRGQNVRITIPVASTEGEVMAVPIAALSAAADGSDVVELLAPTSSDPYATEMIPVTSGLAASGFVEITSSDSRITPGARIVVGR